MPVNGALTAAAVAAATRRAQHMNCLGVLFVWRDQRPRRIMHAHTHTHVSRLPDNSKINHQQCRRTRTQYKSTRAPQLMCVRRLPMLITPAVGGLIRMTRQVLARARVPACIRKCAGMRNACTHARMHARTCVSMHRRPKHIVRYIFIRMQSGGDRERYWDTHCPVVARAANSANYLY